MSECTSVCICQRLGALYNQAEHTATTRHTSLFGAQAIFVEDQCFLMPRHQGRKVTPRGCPAWLCWLAPWAMWRIAAGWGLGVPLSSAMAVCSDGHCPSCVLGLYCSSPQGPEGWPEMSVLPTVPSESSLTTLVSQPQPLLFQEKEACLCTWTWSSQGQESLLSWPPQTWHFIKDGVINVWLKQDGGSSLVAQWLGICLPMQGTRVRALAWEDPTCRRAARPVSHDYWACASGACAPQWRGRDSERPAHRDEEWPPLAGTAESPRTETKTQHTQK